MHTASWLYPKPMQTPYPPIILGGETDYTLKRVVRYCDGWLPRARDGFDAVASMNRLRHIAASAGREMQSLSVSVFGAPADPVILAGYRAAGISRAILPLPSVSREKILPILDQYQALLET